MALVDKARMDDSDSEGSAVSCISNEEDFEEGEDDADYLALEMVNYLPADKAHKFMASVRSKERAIQDLLKRNRSLLDTCDKLDQENQTATERCDELARRAEVAESEASESKSKAPASEVAKAAPAEIAKPAPKVDTSYFMKQEMGKEEKILRLGAENQRLAAMNRHCQEQVAQMDARMQELEKESKTMKRKIQENQKVQEAPPRRAAPSEMEEEEKLYQEAQGNAANDLMARRMWAQMVEQRKKLAQMLEQVLSKDVLGAVCGWDSELSALDMQVEGLEKCLGGVGKGLKPPTSTAAEPVAATSAAKKKQQGKKGEDRGLDSGWVDETGAQLLDHFEAMRSNLDSIDSARHALEEASQRLGDGAASDLADAVGCEATLRGAEAEAEWIREHNASWIDGVQRLGLGEVAALVDQVESAAQELMVSAPPGILPNAVLQILAGNLEQLGILKVRMAEKTSALEGLQADSVSVGRRVRALQGELKTHKTLLRERVVQGIQGQLRPISDAESRLADALRRQRGFEDRARKEASSFFEDFSAALKRAGGSLSSSGGPPDTTGASVVAARESFSEATKNAKEVRAAVASLRSALARIHRELGEKLSLVLNAVAGDPEPSGPQQRGTPAIAAAASSGAKEDESKGKKVRKKGGRGKEVKSRQASGPDLGEIESEPSAKGAETLAATAAAQEVRIEEPCDEDAALRAELAREFAAEGKQKATRKMSGKDLLKELKDLKSASESLEERIATRVAKKAVIISSIAEDEDEEHAKEPPKATLRKKRYA